MLTIELKNYSDFSIDYDYNSYNNRCLLVKTRAHFQHWRMGHEHQFS